MWIFAAIMLLSCFEVRISPVTSRSVGDQALLLDWLFYYYAVFKFSVGHCKDNRKAELIHRSIKECSRKQKIGLGQLRWCQAVVREIKYP